VEENWFNNAKNEDNSTQRAEARSTDLAWVFSRLQDDMQSPSVPSWGLFNEAASTIDPPTTVAGMLPILQAPADDINTLSTVINCCMAISQKLGQQHTVITADQPLYSRGKELVWFNPQYNNVILLLGGLHISFNFLKAIGQHLECAGLDDLWIEAGVYAANTTVSMLDGKAYYRAVRGHQLTYEALWHVKWKMFESWLVETGHKWDGNIMERAASVVGIFSMKDRSGKDEVSKVVGDLRDAMKDEDICHLLKEFDIKYNENPNFKFWSTYMEMVEVLLDFIRAQREGNWALQLEAFAAMLPWLSVYNHTNYARWGPIYLADMKLLPQTAPKVYAEFLDGNFVAKRSLHRFNQVSADQATEWMNRMCKMHNGIIGITRNDQARDKFCLTWSERSRISHDTRVMFGLDDDEEEPVLTRHDAQPSRRNRDHTDVQKLYMQLQRFDVFRTAEFNGIKTGSTIP